MNSYLSDIMEILIIYSIMSTLHISIHFLLNHIISRIWRWLLYNTSIHESIYQSAIYHYQRHRSSLKISRWIADKKNASYCTRLARKHSAAVLIQKVFRGVLSRYRTEQEVLSSMTHYSREVDYIELLLRRGIHVHDVESRSACILSLQGSSQFAHIQLSTYKIGNSSIFYRRMENHVTSFLLRDIADVRSEFQKSIGLNQGNVLREKQSSVPVITITGSGRKPSMHIMAESLTTTCALVCSIRVLVDRELSVNDFVNRGRKQWLLLPLKAIYEQTCLYSSYKKAKEFISTSCSGGLRIYVHSEPELHQKNFLICTREILSQIRIIESPTGQFALVFQMPLRSCFFLSTQELPVNQIREVRSGSDSFFLRNCPGVDSAKCCGIFSEHFACEFEFFDGDIRDEFVSALETLRRIQNRKS